MPRSAGDRRVSARSDSPSTFEPVEIGQADGLRAAILPYGAP
jgi:hypothetical protein